MSRTIYTDQHYAQRQMQSVRKALDLIDFLRGDMVTDAWRKPWVTRWAHPKYL